MCSVWDSADRAHCLDWTDGVVSATSGSAVCRLPAVRIATRLRHAGSSRDAVLLLSHVPTPLGHTYGGVRTRGNGASLVNAGLIVLGMGVAVTVLALATSWFRRDHHADLGSVSHHWIAEQRLGQGQDPHR